MKILLTNDDGYEATGIQVLKKLLDRLGEVYVVAPEHHMSGMSAASTIRRPITVHKHNDHLYSIVGTPVDCVSYGLTVLGIKFDLVFSGINSGYNLSYDVDYSGTVGAAIQSLILGVPSIALSCEANYDIVERYFNDVYSYIITNKLLSTDFFPNVNFPKGIHAKGIELSRLHIRNDIRSYSVDGDQVIFSRITEENLQDDSSDCYHVENGYISITPLCKTYFNESLYQKLKK